MFALIHCGSVSVNAEADWNLACFAKHLDSFSTGQEGSTRREMMSRSPVALQEVNRQMASRAVASGWAESLLCQCDAIVEALQLSIER